jgi:hypothetical protein
VGTRKSPRFPEGLGGGRAADYFAAISANARWKNRAQSLMRRTIFAA